MAPVSIRPAGPNDAPAIAVVLYQSFAECRPLYTERGFAATALTAEQIVMRMQEGPVWAALREAVVLGTVSAVANGESVYIRGMAVLPVARGSGTGAALLRCVEDWAVSQGSSRLFLSTTPFLDSAIRLYQGSGFSRTDKGPHELFGTPLFTMEKEISKPE